MHSVIQDNISNHCLSSMVNLCSIYNILVFMLCTIQIKNNKHTLKKKSKSKCLWKKWCISNFSKNLWHQFFFIKNGTKKNWANYLFTLSWYTFSLITIVFCKLTCNFVQTSTHKNPCICKNWHTHLQLCKN